MFWNIKLHEQFYKHNNQNNKIIGKVESNLSIQNIKGQKYMKAGLNEMEE